MADLTASLTVRLRALGLDRLGAIAQGFDRVRFAATRAAQSERLRSFGAGLTNVRGAMRFAADANQAAEGLGRVQVGLTNVLRKPIQDFMTFEQVMARVRSKMDAISSGEFEQLKRAAQDAGASVGFTSVEAADGLAEMAAAGFSVRQQMAALPQVLQLAKGGEVSVARATAIAANTMAQFGLKAQDTAKIGDVLLAASNASTIGLEEVAETLKYVGPIAKSAGLTLQSTAAFTALLGNSGIEASQAGTSLRGMLGALSAPSTRAKKALQAVGLSAGDLASGVEDPIKLLGRLQQSFDSKNMTKAERMGVIMRVFGREVAPAVTTLMESAAIVGEDGSTGFQRMARAIEDSGGAMQRASDILGNTAASRLAKLRAEVDKLSTQVGERWTPALEGAVAAVKPVIQNISTWAAENPQLVSMIGQATAATLALVVAVKAATLAAGAFALTGTFLAKGVALLLLPLKFIGGYAVSAAAAFNILSIQAGLAGSTTAAAALRFGALATQGLALAGALWAGWEAGKALDGVLGKMTGARGGKLSTEAALQMGESDGFNSFVGGLGETLGSQTLKDIAAGNMRRNAEEAAASRNGYADGVSVGQTAVSPAVGQVNAVTGAIEVTVKDDRVSVRTNSKGSVGLRTGQNAGAR